MKSREKLLAVILVLSQLACNSNNPASPPAPAVATNAQTGVLNGNYTYRKLNWVTSGGGDIAYSIEPDGMSAGNFTISISTYDFRSMGQRFVIGPSQGALYTEIQSIFLAQVSISAMPQTTALSGSWNSVSLYEVNGRQTEIRNPNLSVGSLQSIFDHILRYIVQQLGGGTTPVPPIGNGNCGGLTSLAGNWTSTVYDANRTIVTYSQIYQTYAYANSNIGYDPRNTYPNNGYQLYYQGTDYTQVSSYGYRTQRQESVSYVYDPHYCTLYQSKNSGSTTYKIVSYSFSGKRRVTLAPCQDLSCQVMATYPAQNLVIIEQ